MKEKSSKIYLVAEYATAFAIAGAVSYALAYLPYKKYKEKRIKQEIINMISNLETLLRD